MQYSLLNRFRGTFLGAALGEIVSQRTKKQPQDRDSWGQMAILGAESLIELGRFDLDSWREVQRVVISESLQASSKPSTQGYSLASAIAATLPVALFYHDNEIKLRQNLLSLVSLWSDDLVLQDGVLVVGYAIAQALTEKLNPADLIPQTINFLGETQTPLVQQLAQVQTSLASNAGLEPMLAQLGREFQPCAPIILALYCFLSTVEDMRLSVLRAARAGYQLHLEARILAPVIAGALSGAYNSTVGIPRRWITALSQPKIQHEAGWSLKTEAEMLQLAESLLAVWSGVYDRVTLPPIVPMPAIAAPSVIRRR